ATGSVASRDGVQIPRVAAGEGPFPTPVFGAIPVTEARERAEARVRRGVVRPVTRKGYGEREPPVVLLLATVPRRGVERGGAVAAPIESHDEKGFECAVVRPEHAARVDGEEPGISGRSPERQPLHFELSAKSLRRG